MKQQNNNSKGVQLNNLMKKIFFKQMDRAEMCNQLRVAQMAKKIGLRAGWNLHLTTCDDRGQSLDSNNINMRNVAVRHVIQDEPRLFIGSPMCGPSVP